MEFKMIYLPNEDFAVVYVPCWVDRAQDEDLKCLSSGFGLCDDFNWYQTNILWTEICSDENVMILVLISM